MISFWCPLCEDTGEVTRGFEGEPLDAPIVCPICLGRSAEDRPKPKQPEPTYERTTCALCGRSVWIVIGTQLKQCPYCHKRKGINERSVT